MYFISQIGKNDCAFTCLKIILANYQKDKNYLFLKHEDTTMTFNDVIKEGKKYGVKLLGVKIFDVTELFKNKKFPIIVNFKSSGSKIQHSVLVLRANRFGITIYDPAFGKMRLSVEEFRKNWTSCALIVSKIEKRKCPNKPLVLHRKRDTAILMIFQVLSGGALFGTTYFLDEAYMYFIPFIFLALFALFELLFRKHLTISMEHIDGEIYAYEIDKQSSQYMDIFELIQKYKYNCLTLIPNLIYGFIILALLVTLLAVNNTFDVVYAGISFIIALIEFFILDPIFKKKEQELVKCENEINDSTDDYEFRFKGKRMSIKASRLGFLKAIVRYIEIVFVMIFAFTAMYLSGTVNITYVVFYACVSVALSLGFNKILNFAKMSDDYDTVKAKLLNYLNYDNASKDEL